MSKSRIGATTAISAIACPLSLLTRGNELRTIPLSKIGGWVHDRTHPRGRTAVLGRQDGRDGIDRAADRAGQSRECHDAEDGDHAQNDAVLRHRLALLIADQTLPDRRDERLKIRVKLEHFRSHLPLACWLEHAVFIVCGGPRRDPPSEGFLERLTPARKQCRPSRTDGAWRKVAETEFAGRDRGLDRPSVGGAVESAPRTRASAGS